MFKKEILLAQNHLDYVKYFQHLRNLSSANQAIRASTQNTEINSEIVLEIFNTLFLSHFTNISHATLTSLYESETIAEARKAVKENLAAQRQRKFSK